MSDILKSLEWRYATKMFDPEAKLESQVLDSLLEALRLTASSFGLQPWHFVVVRDAALRQQLKEVSYNQAQVTDASDLIVFCRPETVDQAYVERFVAEVANARNQESESLEPYKNMLLGFLGKLSPADLIVWMEKQVYIALGNLLTVCAALKVDACPMEGIQKLEYDRILGLNESGLHTVFVCPVGYRSHKDRYSGVPKVRFDLKSLVSYR